MGYILQRIVMNPRAEAMQSAGLVRPSLGYPGAELREGLEAVERIEVVAAELAPADIGGHVTHHQKSAAGSMG
jgi:hypothetical protein